jgi:hypothetical protein
LLAEAVNAIPSFNIPPDSTLNPVVAEGKKSKKEVNPAPAAAKGTLFVLAYHHLI